MGNIVSAIMGVAGGMAVYHIFLCFSIGDYAFTLDQLKSWKQQRKRKR